jgi:hypothetical protein
VQLVWLEIRTIHLSEGNASTWCPRFEPSFCIGDEKRRNVDALATSAIGFRQANQELALNKKTPFNLNYSTISTVRSERPASISHKSLPPTEIMPKLFRSACPKDPFGDAVVRHGSLRFF